MVFEWKETVRSEAAQCACTSITPLPVTHPLTLHSPPSPPADVSLSSSLSTITNLQAAYLSSSGQLVGSFQMVVDAPASTTAAGRRRGLQHLESSDGTMPLIFAAGDVASDGTPVEHYADSSGSLPLAAASSAGAATLTADDSVNMPLQRVRVLLLWLLIVAAKQCAS